MPAKISLSKLQRDIHTALQLWHETITNTSPLDYLRLFQLAQVSGGLETRRYTIHRLTEIFLLKEAVQWQA